MKLIRFGTVGNEKPGVQLQDGTRIDVSDFIKDYNEEFCTHRSSGLHRTEALESDQRHQQ